VKNSHTENTVSDMWDLNEKIKGLEALQKVQTEEIKVQFRHLADSVSPKNLLKSAVRTVISTPGLKTTAIDTAIGAAAGNLGRRLVTGRSGGFVRKLAGNAVKFILSNVVRNKMPAVKSKLATATHNGLLH